MLKEYKTVREVVGPLMLVDEVEGIKYEKLVEINIRNRGFFSAYHMKRYLART